MTTHLYYILKVSANSTRVVLAGCIYRILAPKDGPTVKKESAIVIVEQFDIAGSSDIRLNMPVLAQSAVVKAIMPRVRVLNLQFHHLIFFRPSYSSLTPNTIAMA